MKPWTLWAAWAVIFAFGVFFVCVAPWQVTAMFVGGFCLSYAVCVVIAHHV